MEIAIRCECEDFVAVDAKCCFFDAVAQFVDPQCFTRLFVETVEERRVSRGNIDATMCDNGR